MVVVIIVIGVIVVIVVIVVIIVAIIVVWAVTTDFQPITTPSIINTGENRIGNKIKQLCRVVYNGQNWESNELKWYVEEIAESIFPLENSLK